MKSYFVEGLQGAGKTSYVSKLEKQLAGEGYRAYREGDYSPVELAWCAYLTEPQYKTVLQSYAEIVDEIIANTYVEDEHRVVCYTRIITDLPGFHKYMEQYEIYNGNMPKEKYEKLLLKRFDNWKGENEIFECSIFQNIIENDILFYKMSDDEIISFYLEVAAGLQSKAYEIIYLETENIADSIDAIRRERSDENGNELWFPMMIQYMEQSPYGKQHNLKGFGGLVNHLRHRQELELNILERVFADRFRIVKSRSWQMGSGLE